MKIETDKIYCGDSLQVLQTLPDNCMDCCVTSPPYYALRDYGTDGQIGREATPEEYVSRITAVFHEVKRVLTPEGTCWLNIADTYCGTGSKADHRLVFAQFYHLAQGKRHAGKHAGQTDALL